VPERRETLKIIGAIGATCAFPFAADELYGQHTHPTPVPATLPPPSYFNEAELRLIAYIADLIIPRTTTPGAADAGVPAYIDYVCSRNAELGRTIRSGLAEGITEHSLVEMERAGSAWFIAFKNVTADGYFTSKPGLVDELGYQGNAVLAEFPTCEIPEH
jgi:hypothetical protein